MLKPVKKIQIPDWMSAAESVVVMTGLEGFGENPKSLFVGGCVRNELLGKPVEDIDIATQYTPEEVMDIFSDVEGIQCIPTGLDHGTITVVFRKKHFEITTLRKDIETDGRHAVVGFTKEWAVDAKRRDFTINTLLSDGHGNIYDPLETGISDLENKRIVFVGDPEGRIQEDYLRILRFFRFYGSYGEGGINQDGLKACAKHADGIKTLSRERITNEFLKILAEGNAPDILKIMFDNNVLSDLPSKKYERIYLKKLCALQEQYEQIDIAARLFVLGGFEPAYFDESLRLPHALKNKVVKFVMAANTLGYDDDKSIKKAIFHYGHDLVLQGYLLKAARGDLCDQKAIVDMILNWQAPDCPINGQTLIDEGYETGPELGQELERRQEEWLDEVLD